MLVTKPGARHARGDDADPAADEHDRELAGTIGEIVRRIAMRMRQSSARRLELRGITDAEARALRLVGRSPAPLRMSDIARRTGVVPRSATTVVAALEDKGIVRRGMDPSDRRSVVVTLTDAGRRLWQEAVRDRDDEASALLAALSRQQRELLLQLLLKVAGAEVAGPERPRS